jgi:hypothetical protein
VRKKEVEEILGGDGVFMALISCARASARDPGRSLGSGYGIPMVATRWSLDLRGFLEDECEESTEDCLEEGLSSVAARDMLFMVLA